NIRSSRSMRSSMSTGSIYQPARRRCSPAHDPVAEVARLLDDRTAGVLGGLDRCLAHVLGLVDRLLDRLEGLLDLLAPLEAELVAAEPGLVEVDAGQLGDLDAAELERLIDDAAGEADADLGRGLERDPADQAPRALRALLFGRLVGRGRAALGVRRLVR